MEIVKDLSKAILGSAFLACGVIFGSGLIHPDLFFYLGLVLVIAAWALIGAPTSAKSRLSRDFPADDRGSQWVFGMISGLTGVITIFLGYYIRYVW